MSGTPFSHGLVLGRTRSASNAQNYLQFGSNAPLDVAEAVAVVRFVIRAATEYGLAGPPRPFPFLLTLGSDGGVILGGQAGLGAGWSVTSAGDVNRDGFADVVIGAPSAGDSAGLAYVLFGGAEGIGAVGLGLLTSLQGFAIAGGMAGGEVGWSVAGAGDFNRDGFADIAVGARRSDAAGHDSGEAWLIFGHGGPFPSLDLGALAAGEGLRILGADADDFAGFSVAAAGDVNGDGFADLIVGAPHAGDGEERSGAAYVIFGQDGAGPTLDLAALTPGRGFVIRGHGAYSYAGSSVASAGDVNGDGFDDLIVGVPRGASGGAIAGEAYVVFGHAGPFGEVDLANLDPGEGFVLRGAAAYDYAGSSVASAGDINGDGFGDLIIGARYADADHDEGDTIGKAYVVLGHDGPFDAVELGALAPGQGFEIRGQADFVQAGLSVASAGDINGDGFGDLIIGAPYAGDGHRGRAYLIFGGDGGFGTIALGSLTPEQGFIVEGPSADALAGWSVAAAGDVNADGYDDLIVGAPGVPGKASDAGAAYILYGHATEEPPLGPPTVDLNGAEAGTGFAATFAEGGAGAPVGQNIAVTGLGGPALSATITVTDAAAGDALILAGALPATIAVQSGEGTAQLVLAGTGLPGDWAAALALVRYLNASDNPDAFGADTVRAISVVVSDGLTSSAPAIATIDVVAVNDAPSLATSAGARAYEESVNAAPALLAVDPGLTLADPDDSALAGATVTIAAGYEAGEDLLAFANTNAATFGDISASYSAGVLSLSSAAGAATLAQWQAALRAVTYANLSDEPSEATRAIAFAIHDGNSSSGVATRLLSVTAQNDSPTGADGAVTIPEDSAFTFSPAHFGFSDADGDAFAGVRFGVAPAGGTLLYDADGDGPGAPLAITTFPTAAYAAADIAAGRLSFVPAANLNGAGAASIGFTVIDNGGTAGAGQNADVAPNTLRFDIVPVNDAPSGTDKAITIDEDAPYTLTLADFGYSDPDGHPFDSVIFSPRPTGGTLLINGTPMGAAAIVPVQTIQAGGVAFVPAADAHGAIGRISFQVRDDGGGDPAQWASDPSANDLNFVANPIADAPAGEDAAITMTEDGAHTLAAADFPFADADGDGLGAVHIDSISGGTLLFDADGGGPDSAVEVTNFPFTIAKADLDAGKLSFRPAADAHGAAAGAIRFRIQDDSAAGLDTDPVANALIVGVTPVNDAPVANDDANGAIEDGAAVIGNVGSNDSDVDDGATRTYALNAPAPAGLILNPDGNYSFDPSNAAYQRLAAGATQVVAVSYTVTDDQGATDTAMLTITIEGANDAPVAGDDASSAIEDGPLVTGSVAGNDGDVDDGSTRAYALDAPVAGLTLNGDGSYSFDPSNAAYQPIAHGAAQVVVATYRVTDDQGASDTATLTITVTGVNDAPNAESDEGATREDEALVFDPLSLTANDSDEDGDPLSVVAVGNAAGGAVLLFMDGSIIFTPDADFNGIASFGYSVSDGHCGITTATVTVTVAAVNDAPGGSDRSVSLLEDHSYAFIAEDFGFADPTEGHQLAALIIAALPGSGVLALNGQAVAAGQSIALSDLAGLLFTPAANGTGDDYASLAFQVRDDGGTAEGGQDTDPIPNIIRFDVVPVDDAPVITGPTTGDVVEPGGVDDEDPGAPSTSGNLDFSDVDNPEDVWQAVTAGADSLFGFGSYGVTAAGDWTYVLKKTHAAIQALDGTATLTDMFTMLTAAGTEQIVTITIHGQNDAPVNSVPGAQALLEDGGKIFSGANGNAISVADVDAASLSVTLSVAHGTLTLSGTSGLSFVSGANGSATMTVNGTAAAINAALDGLAYSPTANYNGADSLKVSTSDGSLTDTDSIDLTIGAVNDAPTVSIGDGGGAVFAGDTFLVDAFPSQAFPSGEVTALADGGFVVVWTSNGLAGPYHAQRYDADGAAVGPEAEIKGYVVVALEGGDFIALGRPFGPDGDGRGILAQRYDGAWNEVGAEFIVNSVTAGAQDDPAAAALDGGGFVVTWTSSDGSGNGIYAQRYDEMGNRAGGQFRVNTATANSQGIPKVEALPGGGFVVIWITGQSLANGGPDVFGQRYDAAGLAIGAEFRVNSLTAGIQFNPAVAVLEDGGFVIVWEGLAPDGAGGISGRRYDSAGNALGTEFRISAPNDLFQQAPDVTALAGGGFVVTWDTNGPGDGDNIFALSFDSAGRPVGTEFRVDTVTESVGGPSIAGLAGGGFAIAWTSGGDTVHGRRMEPVFHAVEQVALDLKGEILVGDVDAGSGTIGVTLTVASGILHVLPGTSGASVSGDGSASVTITGTLVQVNALLGVDAASVVAFTADSEAPPASTNLSVTISDNGNSGDGGTLTAIATQTIAIRSVNDAPVNSVPGAQTTNEDTSFTLSSANGNAISVADVDSTTLTVTLSVAHGTLTLASIAGLSFSGGSDGTNDVAMTFSGTAAAINAALGSGLTYNPAANYNGQDAISLTTADGAGGGAQTDGDSIFVTINPVNDQPFGADKAITLNEDGSYSIAVADFGFSDPVEGHAFLAVFVNGVPNQGELRLNGNLVVSGQTIMVTDIAAGGLIFTPGANQFGQAYGQFSYQVMDDGGGANFAVMSRKITFDVAPVNDAPVNGVPGAQAIDEDGGFTLSAANANAISVADVDATTLTVTLTVQHGTLTLASIAGLDFGTGDGTADPTMTFTGTAAAINAALGAGLAYNPAANYNGPDAISLTTTDNGQSGIGGILTDSDSVAITVASVNDAPSGSDSVRTLSEDGSYIFATADFGFGDADGGVLLNLILASAPSNGELRLDGVALAAFPATVGAGDIAAGRLSFHPNANENGAGYASFTFRVQDDGGTANGGQNTDQSPNSVTFNVIAVNDIATLDMDGMTAGRDFVATYTENAAPVRIAPNALVSDLDSADFAGGQLGVFFASNGVLGDSFSIVSSGTGPGQISTSGSNVLYGGVVIASGTHGSGSMLLNLNANATPAAIQALLRQVAIASTRDSFTAASWAVAIELNDGDGSTFVPGSVFAGGVIDIVAVDDAAVAQPDAFAVTETGTIASGNLFANDGDVDGPGLAISAVNGSGADVGKEIALASGALLRVNANGTFSYNPNGAFLSTPAPGSGASNTPALDSFSYTLAGGNIALVAIAVTGVDSEGDILIGSNGDDLLNGGAGADRMIGGAGGDSYFVDNVGDVVIEAANEGYDIIYAGVSYALVADNFVEVLATIDNTATTPLNLTGNGLANYVTGNAGANLLDGGAGADQLWGRGGDDSYYADAGDDVVEYDGDGYDILYARSSYGLGVGQSIEVLATIDNTATTAINLIGNALNNYIVGNAGANTLDGGGGSDQLWGREGDDSYIADMNDIVLEYAGQGSDILYATSSYILADGLSIETLATVDNTATTAINLTGNALDNYVTGNAGANILDGGTGSDTLWGRGGDDSYFADGNDVVLEDAGQGSDIIYARGSFVLGTGVSVEILATVDNMATTAINLTGNELANYVTGNAGANILDGGAGADQLYGRGGTDTFAFTTALGNGNVDQILDFVSGADRIALDDAIFSGIGAPGSFNPNAFFAGTAAHDADDRILYNPQTGQLFFDADGSGAGAAVLFAVVIGAPTIAASDFMVI